MRRLCMFASIAAVLLTVSPVFACPMCKDAVESGSTDADNSDDPLREAKAYNNSIYLMIAVPYGLVGGMGYYGYRQIQRRQK